MELTLVEIQYLRGLIWNDKIKNDYIANPDARISQNKSMHNFTRELLEKLDKGLYDNDR
jgi:hypothetical protein